MRWMKHPAQCAPWLSTLRLAMAALLVGALLAACGAEETTEAPTTAPVAEAPTLAAEEPTAMAEEQIPEEEEITPAEEIEAANVTLSEVTDNTDAYLGQTVVVQGDVTDLVGTNSFTLNDASLLGGDSVLVVGTEGGVIGREGDTVQVTGTVRQFDLASIEQEAGYDLEDELFTPFEGQTVIVAQSMRTVAGDLVEAITLSDIAEDPAAYVGTTVTVRGDLGEKLGEQAFVLEDDQLLSGENFVVVAQAADTLPADLTAFDDPVAGINREVQVTGAIQPFDLATIEQEIGTDLQDDLFAAYEENSYTIIAESVNIIGDQAGTPAEGGVATVSEIVSNPELYFGQNVLVQGDVNSIFSPTIFTLDEEALLAAGIDNDLLVIAEDANAYALDDGWLDDSVQVQGIVRQLVTADIERDLNIDLTTEIEAEYESRPVIIAASTTRVP